MTTTYDRAAARKADALTAFVQSKGRIDALLARLAAHSTDHFGLSPDEVNWGHVGQLGRYEQLLRQISDAAFREGEHAE